MHEVELVDRVCGIVGAGCEGAPSREDVRVIVMTALDVLKVPVLPDGQVDLTQRMPSDVHWIAWLESDAGRQWQAAKALEARTWERVKHDDAAPPASKKKRRK